MPETVRVLSGGNGDVSILNAAQPHAESAQESIPLLLPSQLPPSMRLPTTQPLAEMESKLRYAQTTDALGQLRHSLCVQAHLTKYKQEHVRGQRPNTRARALIDAAASRTDLIAERYRQARWAYGQLNGPGDWENSLRPLHARDICTLAEDAEDSTLATVRTGPREGHRTLSWIWRAPGVQDSNSPEMHEGIWSIPIDKFNSHELLSTHCSVACRMGEEPCQIPAMD